MKKIIFLSISNIVKSLNKKQKIRLYIITSLIFISVILETISIGLVVPIVSLILNPKSISENYFNFKIFNEFDQTSLIIIFVCSIALFFILKNSFIIFLNWIQNKELNKTSLELSQKLYKVYLSSPYEFHSRVNKSVLFNNVQHITTFVTGLEALMLLIAELFILLGILFVLMYFEFVGTIIIISIFISCSLIIFLLTSKRLASWGKLRFLYSEKKLRIVNQVFTGIKELKILNRNQFFFDDFSKNEKSDLEIGNKEKIINLIPRLSFEIVFILCIFSFIFYKIQTGFIVNNVISILALYAAAFFRIFPSISRSTHYVNRIINISKIIEEIHKELISTKEIEIYQNEEAIIFKKKLSVKNIKFKFNNRSKQVLNSLNLEINFGEKIGIIGETGSGKSTLINTITGLIKPQTGNILIDDKNIEKNIVGWQKQIGYVSQDTFIIDDTLIKNIALGVPENKISNDKIEEVIEQTKIKNFANSLPKGLNTEIGEDGAQISGGQKQRIGIARALYSRPKLLILDEATSALDVEVESEILSEINKLKNKVTIIIISHRTSTLVGCDKVFKLEKGILNLQ